MPLPIETLRSEKHVGVARNSAAGIWAIAAFGARARGVDSAAENGAATFPGCFGAGDSRQRVGYRVSPGRLVWIRSASGAANPGEFACGSGAGSQRSAS